MTADDERRQRVDTRLVRMGRDPVERPMPVNPPIRRASTILFPSVSDFDRRYHRLEPYRMTYGINGTETTFALERSLAELEGGYAAIATNSGLSAITHTMLGLCSAGDHLLVTDNCYEPVRSFCDQMLARLGIMIEYFDPLVGAGIEALIRPETRLVHLESPGSLTFELHDTPAITAVTRQHGIWTMLDNTWATPLFHRPLDLGVDISVHASTKYIGGHSDLMQGIVVTSEAAYEPVKRAHMRLGQHAAPEDVYLALRGLRSLAVRLERHQRTAITLAEWLGARPEVARVLYPALPGHPQHGIFARDFQGASGLFAFELEPCSDDAVDDMVDGMDVFGIGASWGGFESLLIPAAVMRSRTATAWSGGPVLRLHAGLEAVEDLIDDLERGFGRLRAADAGTGKKVR
jgi:cystathionine beta-lyase